MGEMITSLLCIPCGVYHRKNYNIFGDYNEEGVLQSYCPCCGYMHPPIDVNHEEVSISIKKRKRLGVQLSMKYNLQFSKVGKLISELKYETGNDFLTLFINKIKVEFSIDLTTWEILEFLEGSG